MGREYRRHSALSVIVYEGGVDTPIESLGAGFAVFGADDGALATNVEWLHRREPWSRSAHVVRPRMGGSAVLLLTTDLQWPARADDVLQHCFKDALRS